MDMMLKPGSIQEIESPLAIVGVFADEPLPLGLAELIEPDDFSGGFKQTLLVYTGQSQTIVPRRVLLLGLGNRDDVTTEQLRRAFAAALNATKHVKIDAATAAVPEVASLDRQVVVRAVADGLLLADYRFDHFKGTTRGEQDGSQGIRQMMLIGDGDPAVVELAQTVARGVLLARDLGNEPAAVCTPTRMAELAREIAGRGGMRLTVLDREQMAELGMGCLLGVAAGSREEPKFIVLEYGQKGQGKTLALVGKGVTFDSGGISIKPALGMDRMKMDMMGAAAVLATMSVVADLQPQPIHLVGIVGATENMVDGNAYKPGDILKALNGVMVEIINTDAEGRLVLADGLSYAQRFEPDAIIDLATLTGGALIALGTQISLMITNNAELAQQVKYSGEATDELVWELPLLPEYREQVLSKIADIKNQAGKNASSITAGAFLEHFVDRRPWVHLDIAGTGWVEEMPRPYNLDGASGVGVRLLIDFIQRMATAR